MYDILLKNGLIVDGTGEKAYQADLAVENGKIAAISPAIDPGLAKETVDVSGLVVAPGFIDMHSHSDLSFLRDDRGEAKLYQGVTSELVGQCGNSPYPCPPGKEDAIEAFGRTAVGNFAACSLEAYVNGAAKRGSKMGTNLLPLIGHGTLRCGFAGYENRAVTDSEMKAMRALLREQMAFGAWGLSLGLGYTPGVSADEEELCLLGEEVAPFDGIVTSHMRNQNVNTLKSLQEMYAIGRHSGVKIHIAHFKAGSEAVYGRMPEFLNDLRQAAASGLRATSDVYPYTAASSNITNSFPKWSIRGGTRHAVELLQAKGPEHDKLMTELEESLARRAADSIVIVSTFGALPDADGKSIQQCAALWNVSPAEAAGRIAVATNAQATAISFCMDEKDVEYMLSQPDVSIGSDGYALSFDPALNDGKPHPRSFGTFVRFLKLAREKQLCSLETAVNRITGLTAGRIGLTDRGLLREGLVADVTVFDWNTVADTATYQEPFQKPIGVHHVLMDGRFAIKNGVQTADRLGKILLKK